MEAIPDAPVTKKFRLQCAAFHLTYKTHVPPVELRAFVIERVNRGEPQCWSVVWENADKTDPYEHTHAFFFFTRRPNITDARAFDWVTCTDGEEVRIHPNVKFCTTRLHRERCWEYHEKDPVRLERSARGPLEASNELTKRVAEAPSLFDAIELAGVDIKSISDVIALRSHRELPVCVPRFRPEDFVIPVLGAYTCLFVSGPSNTGKTQWALSQFKRPLLVSHQDDLRHFSIAKHDGIVFDDFSLSHWPRESVIHLVDYEEDRSIHCRYQCAYIPAKTHKIFTSNKAFEDVFPFDEFGAIRRRFSGFIFVTGKIARARSDVSPHAENHRGSVEGHSDGEVGSDSDPVGTGDGEPGGGGGGLRFERLHGLSGEQFRIVSSFHHNGRGLVDGFVPQQAVTTIN